MLTHECEKKTGKLWEVVTDSFGNCYCKSCGVRVLPEMIEPKILRQIMEKHKRR